MCLSASVIHMARVDKYFQIRIAHGAYLSQHLITIRKKAQIRINSNSGAKKSYYSTITVLQNFYVHISVKWGGNLLLFTFFIASRIWKALW